MGNFDHWVNDLEARSDDLAYVRLLIGDTSPNTADQLFTDNDLAMVIQREGALKLGAATLLDRIAGSELLLGKKITSQDLSTDGVAVARELRAMAKDLRDQHKDTLDAGAWGIAAFQFAELPAVRPEATEYPRGVL